MSIEALFGMNEWEEGEDLDRPIELKFDTYERLSWRSMPDVKELRLALVKQHHSLWAEFIYNAARVLSDLIDSGLVLPDVRGKSWLELGAGAGLPSIITSIHEPSCVVISDYGNDYDRLLLPAIDHNIAYAKELGVTCPIFSVGYIWGSPVERLTSCLASTATSDSTKFDLVVMADCIFNRSEHRRLLWTVKETLSASGLALCSFRYV
jgi:EEF1A N-terminal glycine/lysine methyltransferase